MGHDLSNITCHSLTEDILRGLSHLVNSNQFRLNIGASMPFEKPNQTLNKGTTSNPEWILILFDQTLSGKKRNQRWRPIIWDRAQSCCSCSKVMSCQRVCVCMCVYVCLVCFRHLFWCFLHRSAALWWLWAESFGPWRRSDGILPVARCYRELRQTEKEKMTQHRLNV